MKNVVIICFSFLSSLVFPHTARHGFILQVIQISKSVLDSEIVVASQSGIKLSASTSFYSILFILSAEQNEPLWNRCCQPFLNQVRYDFYHCCKLIWNRILFLFSAKILMSLISTDWKHHQKCQFWQV